MPWPCDRPVGMAHVSVYVCVCKCLCVCMRAHIRICRTPAPSTCLDRTPRQVYNVRLTTHLLREDAVVVQHALALPLELLLQVIDLRLLGLVPFKQLFQLPRLDLRARVVGQGGLTAGHTSALAWKLGHQDGFEQGQGKTRAHCDG